MSHFHVHGFYDRQNDVYVNIMDVNGKMEVYPIKNPKVPAYITKDNPTYIREFVKKDDVIKINVPYKNKEYHYADKLGISNFFHNVQSKTYVKEMVYLDPRLYGADIRIDDYVIQEYNKKNKDKLDYTGIRQAYLDIETDVLVSPGNDIEARKKQPVYLSTYYHDGDNSVVIDYLIDSKYKNQAPLLEPQKFIDRVKNNLLIELSKNEKLQHKDYKDILPKVDNIFRNFKFILRGHTSEKELIKANWQSVMRGHKPHFLQAYNADYDVSQSYIRYEELGGDIKDLFTVPEVVAKAGTDYTEMHCKSLRLYKGTYRPPRDPKFKPTNESQFYRTASYTKILDTAVLHYGLRVKEQDSYKLDDTCKREIGFSKLDYSGTTDDIFMLPYVDFALAVEYNIRDVLLLPVLDLVLNNLQANLIKREITGTEYDNLYSSKQYVTNAFMQIYDKFGFVQRNDVNSYIKKMPREFYERTNNQIILNMYDLVSNAGEMAGGFVSNPNKFIAMGATFIDGIVNYKAHGFSLDIDAASQYPSAIISNRIGLESLWYKIVSEVINGLNKSQIAIKIINRDIVGLGEIFGLPSLHELVEKHYGIKTNYKIFEEKEPIPYAFNPEYEKLKSFFRKLFNDKQNDRDKDAGKFQMNNTIMLSKGTEVQVSYLHSLVEYYILDENGIPFNAQKELLRYVDSSEPVQEKDNLYGYFKDSLFFAYNDKDILSYIKPKKVFTTNDKMLLSKDHLTQQEIMNIRNAKNTLTEIKRANKSIFIIARQFVHFSDNVEVEVFQDSNKNTFFRFTSDNNISISKNKELSMHLQQTFEIID